MSSKRIAILALVAAMTMAGTAFAGQAPDIGIYYSQFQKDVYTDMMQAEAFVAEAADLFESTDEGDGYKVPPALDGEEMIQIGNKTLSSANWMKLVYQSMNFGWTSFEKGNLYRARFAAEFAKSVSLYLVMYAGQ